MCSENVQVSIGTLRGQKMVLGKLQAVVSLSVWVLGTEARTSTRPLITGLSSLSSPYDSHLNRVDDCVSWKGIHVSRQQGSSTGHKGSFDPFAYLSASGHFGYFEERCCEDSLTCICLSVSLLPGATLQTHHCHLWSDALRSLSVPASEIVSIVPTVS